MSAKVTIGICVKNAEKGIKECIDSVLNQTYPKELMQIVVVDGQSKDKTLTIVADSTSNAGIEVEMYSDKGMGLGAARQIAVDHANGEYIAFVDGDVQIFDNFLEEHVKFMEENPFVGIAFGRPMCKEGPLFSTVRNLQHYVQGELIGNDATIYRSEALRQVGGFDLHIKGAAEDKDLISRIKGKGWQISTNEKARFYHDSRGNVREFLSEQEWFGYGDHYFSHKHRNSQPAWSVFRVGLLAYGLRSSLKAYRLTHRKISFLIPLQMALGYTAWLAGFIKGHMNRYGHKIADK